MKKQVIRHRVERTNNKHSRATFRDGMIVIRLAGGLSETEEQEHVDDLLDRMLSQVEDEFEKTLINPFGKLLDSGESASIILPHGTKYHFTLRPGKRTSVKKTRRGFTITIGPSVRRSGLHRLLWKTLAQCEQSRIEHLVHDINNATYGVGVSRIKLQFASSQWGSCSPSGVIMLNAALLFVKPEVLRYVIIHELAHRKRADHSPHYWAWVSWAMPSYERARKALYDYRLPSL